MDKSEALAAVERRAFDLRKPLHVLCREAKVGYSTIVRWRAKPDTITALPLKRLEDRLAELEAAR